MLILFDGRGLGPCKVFTVYKNNNQCINSSFSGNIYDGMKNYQPVFRERESFSSLSGNIFGETKPAPPTMSKIKDERKNFHKKTFLL